MSATTLLVLRTYWEFYEGLTKEEVEADTFNWRDHEDDGDNESCVEVVCLGDDEVFRSTTPDPIPPGFTGTVRFQSAKEYVDVEHSGGFDLAKLDCTGELVSYDGEEFEADVSTVKVEDVVFYSDGEVV